jgi:hypothetical protein
MEIVLKPLIDLGKAGISMVDSLGNMRLCYPRLAAYLADYPEQLLINVAAHNNSPTTIATGQNLGSSHPLPPRSKEGILDTIACLCAKFNPADVIQYQDAAKLRGLSGVHLPFWRDLPGYRPDLCLAPDILHGLHRFWRDHVLQWVINIVGQEELDKRVKMIQPVIGFRHFKDGISHLSQWTGREDRELQRILLAAVSGAPGISGNTLRALIGIQEFIYMAQYNIHDEDSLDYMKGCLDTFHMHKKEFIKNGARRSKNGILHHFNIPKLYALHSYVDHIRQMGASPQFSTEITENCHQTMAKQAYRATNKRDFEKQMCRYLDRTDRVTLLSELLLWRDTKNRDDILEEMIGNRSLDYQELAQYLWLDDADEEMVQRTRPERSGHIWHNHHPHQRNQSLEQLVTQYNLPSFLNDLTTFLTSAQSTPYELPHSAKVVDVWLNCRIQLPLVADDDELAAIRTIQAIPPSSSLPYGRSSFVLYSNMAQPPRESIKGSFSEF